MARALVLLIVLAIPARAHAQRFGHLDASGATGLAIAREEIELRCEAPDERELECAIVARWEITNEGEQARTPELGVSWAGDPEDVEVRVAEAVLATELPTTRRVRVLVPAHAHVVLEIRGRQRLGAYAGTGAGSDIPVPLDPHDPLAARHPLLATRWETVRRGLVWLRSSSVHFESVGPTTFRVTAPEGWSADVHGDPAPVRADDGAITWAPREGDGRHAPALGLELTRGIHHEIVRHGGPFLALGGTIDRGFRGRVGYEIGLGEWVLVSVAAESDFAQQVVITPLVELASYSMLILPSFSAGIGLPIQVAPDLRAGLRLETSATFYALAFVASFDYWPADGTWQVHLLGRIGL